MANFKSAVEYVINNECPDGIRGNGGFTNDPHDAGGATKWGISLLLGSHYGLKTADDVRNLSLERAIEIYRDEFWRYDDIVSQRVATKILDMVVNLGNVRAIQLVQMAVNWAGGSVVVDGRLGGNTLTAINKIAQDRLFACLIPLLEAYYRSRVNIKPSQARFIKGWLNRALKLP